MASGWRGVQVMSVTALASMALVLTACGSSPNAAPTTRGSSADTTGVSKSTTTLNSTASAVLQAYRASWKAFEQASSSANAYDPQLAATMVGTQLQNVRANLLGDQHAGAVGRGTITLHPKIASISATTASVVDCAYSTAELIYAKTGKPVPPIAPPENDGIQSTLVLTGGTWKVSQQKRDGGTLRSRLVISSLFLAVVAAWFFQARLRLERLIWAVRTRRRADRPREARSRLWLQQEAQQRPRVSPAERVARTMAPRGNPTPTSAATRWWTQHSNSFSALADRHPASG